MINKIQIHLGDFDSYIGFFILLFLLVFYVLTNATRVKKQERRTIPPLDEKRKIHRKHPPAPPPRAESTTLPFPKIPSFQSAESQYEFGEKILGIEQPVDRFYEQKKQEKSRLRKLIKKAGGKKSLILLSEILKSPRDFKW